mmetsp:Transcript_37706/g.82521  ORF Transcript_37706/g.82521 Transcript_37706/m.82521 type:complete len:251 (-) Transcript_37706:195-947(-)
MSPRHSVVCVNHRSKGCSNGNRSSSRRRRQGQQVKAHCQNQKKRANCLRHKRCTWLGVDHADGTRLHSLVGERCKYSPQHLRSNIHDAPTKPVVRSGHIDGDSNSWVERTGPHPRRGVDTSNDNQPNGQSVVVLVDTSTHTSCAQNNVAQHECVEQLHGRHSQPGAATGRTQGKGIHEHSSVGESTGQASQNLRYDVLPRVIPHHLPPATNHDGHGHGGIQMGSRHIIEGIHQDREDASHSNACQKVALG